MKQLLINVYEFPRHVFDWCRLWIHCLLKYHLNFKGEDHRMCKVVAFNSEKKTSEKHYFCSCNYMVEEMPEDIKDHATLLNKIGSQIFK